AYFQPFDWHHAAACMPGMAACLLYGVITGDTVTAAIATGAAFSVGFGLRRYRQTRSMLGAVALMTAATLIGSVTSGHFLIFMLLCSAAAAGTACLALIDDDVWWVALQATIALFVASHYASTPKAALIRAGIVFAAGLFQMACVLLLDRILPKIHPKPALNTPVPATPRAFAVYGGVSAVSVAVALVAGVGLHMEKAYWAPMTALIVLKPKFQLTQQRGVERLMGNIFGCALATCIAVLLTTTAGPKNWIDSVLCLLGSGAAYALLKARYAAFSLAVSFTAVMMLFTAHMSAVIGAEQRIYATILGGAIAIAIMWTASRTVGRDLI
ncbi:MAG TPA: FUSC family protein, partial [Asticcacaulis sp.]|nr:FUSC family protein [Asticcacaulis sp.]